jgi:hypothetical protein
MKIPLGIEIFTNKISDDFYKFLLEEYFKVLNDPERGQNHNFFNGCDYHFINDSTRGYIQQNILKYVEQYDNSYNYQLMDQWINIQAHNDFVPLHEHSGDMSYVIYLKVPGYLKKEYEQHYHYRNNGLSYSEGCIEFFYGIKTELYSCSQKIVPEEGQIILFPSQVQHYVYPFKNPSETRVSISGNLKRIKDYPEFHDNHFLNRNSIKNKEF